MKRVEIILLCSLALLIVLYEAFNERSPFGNQPDSELGSTNANVATESPSEQSIAITDQVSVRTATVASPVKPAGSIDSVSDAMEIEYDRLTDNPDYPAFTMRLAEMSSRRDGRTFSPQATLNALRKPVAWTAADEPGPHLVLSTEARHDGRVFVNLDQTRIEALVAGDEFDLPLLQENSVYRMRVESVEVGDHNDITWHGYLTDFANDNQVSITQGSTLTVAGITTPAGHYVLEAHQGSGWIAAGGDLFKQDFDQTDEIIPNPKRRIITNDNQ